MNAFQYVYDKDPEYKNTLAYTLGKLYMDNELYGKAIEPFQYFLKHHPKNRFAGYAEKYLLLSQKRFQILSDSLLNFSPVKLPAEINTDMHEYFPALSVDDKQLIFTRRVSGQEDIYISNKDSLGNWIKARLMPGVNTREGNEGGHCISADGRLFIFTACRREGGFGSCDLFISYKASDGSWSKAMNMGASINTAAWDAQPSLSPDKRTLYFASTRGGGKSKIYYATLQENGSYGDVKKLGKPIASKGNEWAPFIAYDNETLYFSSDGHIGLGDRDLFLSRRDSSGNWTEPINLGPPLNTKREEGTIFINASADKGYITSDIDGSLDIYEFTPDESISPKPVTYIEGYVYDSLERKTLNATVSVLRLKDSTTVAELNTNRDGYYLTCLPLDEEYAFWVEKSGYLFYSSHHEIRDTLGIHNPLQIHIPLLAITDIAENAGITLRNILYETGSSKLLPTAYPELNKLLNFLNENPSIAIRIIGHTDDIGAEKDNQVLSENRAKSVIDYLIKNGISPSRLTSEGKGELEPLVPNDSPANRKINRRTEVKIVKK